MDGHRTDAPALEAAAPTGDDPEAATVAGDGPFPRRYPLLAVLVVLVASAPTSWLIPAEQGYLIAAGSLVLVASYAVVFTSVRLTTDGVFLALIGGYWLGLVVQYIHSPHPELLLYVLATPVAVLATVIVLPQFVAARPETFAAGMTVGAVGIAVFGFALVYGYHTTTMDLPQWVGQPVMGYGEYRTVSVYQNPNAYATVMLVGTLSAVYTLLARRRAIWLVALSICLVGFVLAEGDHAFAGFLVGLPILLSAVDRRLALGAVATLVAGTYVAIQIGHVQDVMQTTFLGRVYRWVEALEMLSEAPLWGVGFDEMRALDVHNSFLHIPLGLGVIVGGLYVGSIWYALAKGIRARWTLWTGYVVGTGGALLVSMWFETSTLGGVSVSAVLLGLFVGLLLGLDREGSNAATFDRRSRIGRAVARLRRR
ncbi:O-antigen ligase family protein [Halovivax gelatinilyticus]|uniref:O-antigen ligase family protein n=1 Tax=Halovivax gelatinilyticus TaxID=2961597 RepID=UPI0020CA6F66|nr:O-antigen ligase domain-containing protein [Halovivax gelatinilyticus]